VPKRRVLAGLLISVLLHAAVLAWLLMRPRPLPTLPAPTELLLVEVNLPPPPPPAPDVPEPPTPVEPPKVRPPRPKAPAVAKAEPTEAPEPPPSDEPPPPEVVSDVPRADAPRIDAPRLAMPSLAMTLTLDAGYVPEEQTPGGLHAPEISKDLVADLARKTIGRGKVDRGLVHPYYRQLGKVLLKNWDADRSVSARGLKGFAESTVENTKAFNKIWLEKAQVYGGSGSPFDVESNGRAKPLNDRLVPGQDLQARREVQREMSKQFRSSRRAEIKVTQASDGKLLKVELLKPSNDVFVDNQALIDVRAAAEKLPPPPEEVSAGKPQLISTWVFELVVSITPPVPTFSFEFDEAIGFVDVRLPLDRRIYKKVKLLSVD
jgi:outer membrane biosynthesis protein TonB